MGITEKLEQQKEEINSVSTRESKTALLIQPQLEVNSREDVKLS